MHDSWSIGTITETARKLDETVNPEVIESLQAVAAVDFPQYRARADRGRPLEKKE